jgi:hypothetical protein
MKRFLHVSLLLVAIGAPACQGSPTCSSVPCAPDTVYVGSPCGFKSFTSTCSGFQGVPSISCDADGCGARIKATRAETCTVTVTYGDGTLAASTLTFTAGDECCPGFRQTRATGVLLPPATCVSDAGVDAAGDASAEASSDASESDADATPDQ